MAFEIPRSTTLVVTLSMSLIFAGHAFGQIDEIRRSITTYESLYDEMEAVYETTLTASDPVIESSVDKSKVEAFARGTVNGLWSLQKYYASNDRTRRMGDGSTRRMIQTQAYDGEMTRINHYDEVGNEVRDRVREYSVKPTYFAIPHLGTSAPLSKIIDYVAGSEPYLSRLGKWQSVKNRHLGQDKKNDDSCEKIEILVYETSEISDSQQPRQRFVLWLSINHNYLVAASETFAPQLNDSLPVIIGSVSAWKEVNEGIFVPASAKTQNFDIGQDGSSLLVSTRTYELTSCKLEADPNDKRFTNVRMPEGKPVYTVDGGKIVETLIDGEPEEEYPEDNEANQGSDLSYFWPVFIVVNIILLGLLIKLKSKRYGV